jgi:hypothetical protein
MEAIIQEQVVALTADERIHRMHQRDRMGAIAFVLALWVTILFVLFSIWSAIGNEAIRAILVVAGGLVLAFNTAAIAAMLRHYHGDKIFIYSLDLMHLDEMRRRRGR